MNNQPPPIHCPQCGKILSKPSEMGEVIVKCEECKRTWLVRTNVGWRYYEEYKPKVGEKKE